MTVNNSRISISLAVLVSCLLVPVVLPVQEASAQEKTTEETWKVNLKNADIREFVTQVSVITGKSFVVDPRIKGNVTVISSTSMDKDTIYELFLSVLRVHGYAAVPSGNITKIVQQVLAKQSGNPRDFLRPAQSEELVTAVIPVRNSASEDLVKILRPLIPQYGHVAGISSPNVLIISDHAGNIARLTEIVNRIDIADNQTVEIIGLKDAWVEDMVGLLQELAPEQIGKGAKGPNRVTIVASERTNSMVIKGQKVTVERVAQLISQLDVPANRSGTTKVIRLAHSDAVEMAEILRNTIVDDEDSNSNKVKISIQPDEAINALVIRAAPSAMLEIMDIIDSLDVRRMQVLIEAAIVEVTADFSRQLGSELFIADVSGSNLPLGLTAPSGTLAQILKNLALGSAVSPDGVATSPLLNIDAGTSPLLAGGRLSADKTSFAAIIRALSTNGDVNLLSTPSITTMDNEEAKIVVGQNVPFRTGSTTSGSNGASNPFTTIQREDVGLTLEVTPNIHDGNLVQLKVHQEVSEVDPGSLSVIGAEGSADLITNIRTIDTTILVDDQEVIIIGGLIRDKETSNNSKVPILGSVPGLGFLFRSTSTTTQKQNLLVFLRPTVLDSRAAITSATQRKFNSVYEVEIEGRDPANVMSDLFNGNIP
ncbi:MAG: type II secretion system secretin GspD [Gammaproteobacteria bacterium]|jgi:general secretion pathway protein D|nr:type II secretion system secretin GspD [Gammaproteobacteria bacterium]MBT3869437.1 type II secretion system secretin GspD [Gammaproteobacteria bacterium]MBT4380136.1 type II secretion system secretin GspD [Gammaproteobacteria bacterium]MBT4615900.1 type II secretion system secretin GspD [Gammaproteobacteria bacterium]MBT5199963.1 type II secretion system secretin GspD [Gammaproteobacteria bacterium]